MVKNTAVCCIFARGSLEFFISTAPTAQNSPELNIRFIDSCIQMISGTYLGWGASF